MKLTIEVDDLDPATLQAVVAALALDGNVNPGQPPTVQEITDAAGLRPAVVDIDPPKFSSPTVQVNLDKLAHPDPVAEQPEETPYEELTPGQKAARTRAANKAAKKAKEAELKKTVETIEKATEAPEKPQEETSPPDATLDLDLPEVPETPATPPVEATERPALPADLEKASKRELRAYVSDHAGWLCNLDIKNGNSTFGMKLWEALKQMGITKVRLIPDEKLVEAATRFSKIQPE